MNEVTFVDTTIRDGAQSLWAYNIRTGMIAPICEQLDVSRLRSHRARRPD